MPGVKEVRDGFLMGREINIVIYDSGRITPAKMISALKAACTYEGLAEKKDRP